MKALVGVHCPDDVLLPDPVLNKWMYGCSVSSLKAQVHSGSSCLFQVPPPKHPVQVVTFTSIMNPGINHANVRHGDVV